MPVAYKGGYVPPARANKARDLSFLPECEGKGMWAQVKKNGTHTVIFVHPDRKVVAWDRRGEIQKAWRFTEETDQIFRSIPGKNWYVFDGELLHNKTKHIKNQIYLYDILVYDGILLTQTEYQMRYQLLFEILGKGKEFGQPAPDTQYWRLDPYTSIARNYHPGYGYRKLFDSLTDVADEGLVCRLPTGIYTGRQADSWMVKFRRHELTKLY